MPVVYSMTTPKQMTTVVGQVQRAIELAVSVGMQVSMEEIRGDISQKYLGPREWTQPSKASPHQWAMATMIAKGEGATDFDRPDGAGFIRAKQLSKKMPTFRPPKPQALWIQSGQLRKSLDWGVISKIPGGGGGRTHKNARLQGNDMAVGFIWARMPYAEKHEFGKYPFVRPAVEAYVKSGRWKKHIENALTQVQASLEAQK